MKYISLILCTGFFLFLTPSLKAQKDSVKNELNETNDWPNLRRYRSENAKLTPPSANGNRVVFMGNSITDGWINARPDFFSKNNYLDRGISGQTTPQMLIRFRQDVIDLHPKVVIILAGINDIAGNTGPSSLVMIEDNLASMAQLAKANGIKVVMCSVLPAYSFPWRQGIDPVQKIIDLNKWIKHFAEKNNFVYVDYYDAMVDERKGLPASLSKDGVHPNAAGYEIMEPLAQKGIAKALVKR
ncbi:MAG TPA: SGNH/GDSL hydrolase family protein [Hanamia sp.]|nr:SGNH/GDSL hydrolase family protein [Hanamia sp.]